MVQIQRERGEKLVETHFNGYDSSPNCVIIRTIVHLKCLMINALGKVPYFLHDIIG